jgi:DNA-binding transcriptional ArsR family regulator
MAKQILDPEKLELATNRLKALANPTRLTIIDLLLKNSRLTVSEIQKILKIEQASTSNHLKILQHQQILSSTRDGKSKYYSIREAKLTAIIKCIEQSID